MDGGWRGVAGWLADGWVNKQVNGGRSEGWGEVHLLQYVSL